MGLFLCAKSAIWAARIQKDDLGDYFLTTRWENKLVFTDGRKCSLGLGKLLNDGNSFMIGISLLKIFVKFKMHVDPKLSKITEINFRHEHREIWVFYCPFWLCKVSNATQNSWRYKNFCQRVSMETSAWWLSQLKLPIRLTVKLRKLCIL